MKRDELKTLVSTLTTEVESLDYEKGQYKEKIVELNEQVDEVEAQTAQNSVQEHEIVVVSALIEEKARLGEQKA